MEMATSWIEENCEQEEEILICTDSQSLRMALRSYNPKTDCIRERLQSHTGTVSIQWIPGHSNVPKNELADQAAKNVSNQLGPSRETTLRSAIMQIRKTFKDNITHARTKTVYSSYDSENEKEPKSRREQVTMAQLRSGKHKALKAYCNFLDEDISPLCQRCD